MWHQNFQNFSLQNLGLVYYDHIPTTDEEPKMTKTLNQLQTWKKQIDKLCKNEMSILQTALRQGKSKEEAMKLFNAEHDKNDAEVQSFYTELNQFHENMAEGTEVWFDDDIGMLVAGEEREDIF